MKVSKLFLRFPINSDFWHINSLLFFCIACDGISANGSNATYPAATFTYKDLNGAFFMAIIVISFVVQLFVIVAYVLAFERLGKLKINWWLIVS